LLREQNEQNGAARCVQEVYLKVRCLDQFWSAIFPGAPVDISPKLRQEVVAVDIDNALRWFYEKSSQEYWNYEKDFPCPLSPWNVAWFEGGTPQFSNNEGKKMRLSSPFRKVGWVVHQMALRTGIEVPSEPIAVTMIKMATKSHASVEHHYPSEKLKVINERGARYTQMAQMFAFNWNGKCHRLTTEYCYLDSDGKMIDVSRGIILASDETWRFTKKEKQQISEECQSYFLALYFTLCLLHTKNISISDEPARHLKGKAVKRLIEPRTRFKILDIRPLVNTTRKPHQSHAAGDEIQRALHLCRGHFRTYTDESKLFGRLTGTFWIPQHTRGSAENGTVDKDYRISD